MSGRPIARPIASSTSLPSAWSVGISAEEVAPTVTRISRPTPVVEVVPAAPPPNTPLIDRGRSGSDRVVGGPIGSRPRRSTSPVPVVQLAPTVSMSAEGIR